MRILFYNWVDYLDDEKRGGGVTIYQRNLMRAFSGSDEIEAVFISSGISYDLVGNSPRWEALRYGPNEDRTQRFEVVNSGVLAPAHHAFGDPAQMRHAATAAVFFDFLRANGPFDVVHFNNLEGLPVEVLELKQHFPATRLVLSLHNYYPFCPQVNLWHQERESCVDFESGRKCETCLLHAVVPAQVRLANAFAYELKKRGIRAGTILFNLAIQPARAVAKRLIRIGRIAKQFLRTAAPLSLEPPTARLAPSVPNLFQTRRTEMIAQINRNCDLVLGVSDRVCEIAAGFGIRPELLQTSYIGTAEAGKFDQTLAKATIVRGDGTLTLAYLGYMRRDKGFYFLLEALEAMPADLKSRLRVLICAGRGDAATMDRLSMLTPQLASLSYVDGYSHDQLDGLLADVDLGVIPVLWQDNLPQVAIEMHARHIPLLTSDMGGAHELSRCPEMVFKAGSIADFTARITAILNGEITSSAYWHNAQAPVSMPKHLAELRELWHRG